MEKNKKRRTKASVAGKSPAFLEFWTKKETKIASGVLLISIALYLTIIFLSFIFTGSSDFSLVKDLQFSEINKLDGDIRNFGGSLGAWISNIIINHWFGFPSLFMIAFI